MKILVTRPVLQAEKTATRLVELGHTPLLQPLLAVEPLTIPQPVALPGGLIITSANVIEALRTMSALEGLVERPVLVTGSSTAQALRDAGFVDVDHVDGAALDIVKRLGAWCREKNLGDSTLLYVSAQTVAHDLADHSASLGLTIVTWPVYKTDMAASFEPTIKKAFEADAIDAVLLYSARTADCFERLFNELGVKHSPECLVLSDTIRAALTGPLRDRCRVARKPTEAALFELLA